MVAVACEPPADVVAERRIDARPALASGHPPTVAEALQAAGFVDLYFLRDGDLRRVALSPRLFGTVGRDVVSELEQRFTQLRLDRRLVGIRPRASFAARGGESRPGAAQRRGYAFGTPMLADLLGAIDPVLRTVPQFEIGSRIAYALDPLDEPESSARV